MSQSGRAPIQRLSPILAQAAGPVLRAAREASGLGQIAFAARIGVDQPHLSRIEMGKICPTLPVLFLVAWGLELPTHGFIQSMERDPALRKALLEILRLLRPPDS